MQAMSLLRLSGTTCTAYVDGQTSEHSLDDWQWPAETSDITVLAPGIDILLSQAEVPARQRQRIAQAVPYSLEENLAEDVDDLHFALGDHAGGGINVAVTRHQNMQSWLDILAAATLTPRTIIPDILAVPRPDDGWGILCVGEHALVHTGLQTGFAIDKALLPDMLSIALAESQTALPTCIYLYRGQQTAHAKPLLDINTIEMLEQKGVECKEKHHAQGLMAWFAEGITENSDTLNLLQARYRPTNKATALWNLWRLTVILAGVWLLLQVLMQWQTLSSLAAEDEALSKQISEVYQVAFPQSPVRGYSLQAIEMEHRLKVLRQTLQGGGESGFLASLSTMTELLEQAPGLQLNRVDYRQQRFDVHLRIAGLQALETLRQGLQEKGFQAEIRSIDDGGSYVEGRLILSPP